MKPKSSNKKKHNDEDDWIYDPIVVKGILKAKKEADEDLKNGKTITLEQILEDFRNEDEKRI